MREVTIRIASPTIVAISDSTNTALLGTRYSYIEDWELPPDKLKKFLMAFVYGMSFKEVDIALERLEISKREQSNGSSRLNSSI